MGEVTLSNSLSPQLIAQLMAQESSDPYLTLLTLSHPEFASDIRLVNNQETIVSRTLTFNPYPFKLKLSPDDGESARMFTIELDNVSLDLVEAIRTVTTGIEVKLEMILASIPDDVQMSYEEFKIENISYNKTRIQAVVILDNFLNTELSSERYNTSNYPGLF